MRNSYLRITIWAAAVVGVGSILVGLLTPPTELTRLRNALIASEGTTTDFDWTPDNPPDGFSIERLPPPEPLQRAARSITPTNGAQGKMKAIVTHLRAKPKQRGPIQSNTLRAYQIITSTGRGYCADYTQVFNALAHSTGLAVREWGMSFDGFGGDGHAFSEIYDPERGAWVFIDPMNGFYARDRESGEPLSAIEFRDRLLEGDAYATVTIEPLGSAFLFESASSAMDYYENGAGQFYLWYGNDVFTYDAHPVLAFLGQWSRSLEQLTAIVLGVHPEIRILPAASNAQEIKALYQFGNLIIVLCVTGMALTLLLLFEISRLLRKNRATTRS